MRTLGDRRGDTGIDMGTLGMGLGTMETFGDRHEDTNGQQCRWGQGSILSQAASRAKSQTHHSSTGRHRVSSRLTQAPYCSLSSFQPTYPTHSPILETPPEQITCAQTLLTVPIMKAQTKT